MRKHDAGQPRTASPWSRRCSWISTATARRWTRRGRYSPVSYGNAGRRSVISGGYALARGESCLRCLVEAGVCTWQDKSMHTIMPSGCVTDSALRRRLAPAPSRTGSSSWPKETAPPG